MFLVHSSLAFANDLTLRSNGISFFDDAGCQVSEFRAMDQVLPTETRWSCLFDLKPAVI